jgi:hypothetical protein
MTNNMARLDALLEGMHLDIELENQVEDVMSRLTAIKNGNTLYFKRSQTDNWTEWLPSYTNLKCMLEGTDESPSIVSMDVEWRVRS